jgi:TonB family protein
MVRAIPNNPWRCADFLERVRPGFAVSAALHIGLLIVLAYFLAFHPTLQIPTDKTDTPLVLIEVPKQGIDIKIPPFVLPPFDGTSSGPPQTTTTTESPAPAVIVNPTPIYRGGLIYPDRAAEMGKEGYVDFDFIIEPDGTVGDPHVVAEVPDGIGFAVAAKKAFPKWRFNPMMKDGHPVAAPARIRVSFKLN